MTTELPYIHPSMPATVPLALKSNEELGSNAQPPTRERPILFSAPMVRAILDGTKTQTRRAVKGWALEWLQPGMFTPEYVAMPENGACPYGKLGDRLWVRESGCIALDKSAWMFSDRGGKLGPTAPKDSKHWCRTWKSCPSIHQPRWASRITLEVTGLRVEHLQEISRGDAMAEGCPFPNMAQGEDPRQWYATLWDQINGVGSWDANPWVWVVEFRRCSTLLPNV